MRSVHRLPGEWLAHHKDWVHAKIALVETIRMAHEVGVSDVGAETRLALCRFHLGQLPNPRHEAERLSAVRDPENFELAQLWQAIGDFEKAGEHALAAYRYAWADGEPSVRRYELDDAAKLLNELGVEIPTLPGYDPTKLPKRPWEHKVESLIAKPRTKQDSRDRDDPSV